MKKLLILLAFLSLFFATIPAFGRQGIPNTPDQIITFGPNGPTNTPISGMAVLAILGGSYAVIKLRDSNHGE